MQSQFSPLEVNTWSRKKVYEFFESFHSPIYSLTTQVELTAFYRHHKQNKTLSSALVHAISYAANMTTEFLFRQRKGAMGKWNVAHPSITVAQKGLFNFCRIPFSENWLEFSESYQECLSQAKNRTELFDPAETDNDLFYFSITPWFSFSAVTHPLNQQKDDTIPRFCLGKIEETQPNTFYLPLNLQVNHSFIDAFHIAQFLGKLKSSFQKY